MVANSVLLKGLRSLGYSFKKAGKRTDIYKKSGFTDRVTISRRSIHSREYVDGVLAKCGMTGSDIVKLLGPPPAQTKSGKKP